MARRYLDASEAAAALRRGKAVECFLGACGSTAEPGIRWLSMREKGGQVAAAVYECRDEGSEDFLDVYAFRPLDAEPRESMTFPNFSTCVAALSKRWPRLTSRLVNEGMVQDEYADYLAGGRARGNEQLH